MQFLAELKAITQALDARGVEYALCGAVALAIHGVPRATQDIDLLARSADLDALREAVRGCGFTLEALPMTFSSSGITVHRFTKILDGHPLMLDVLEADGPLESVWKDRQTLAWTEGQMKVVSRRGLISLKLAAGRPQDIVDVQRLQEIEDG